VFELKRQLALPWHARLRQSWRERWPARVAAAAWRRGALVLLAALRVPVPWRVSAPARLEGAVQRAIVAATDGFLQQANVRPGDRVQAGQVLAELSSQDLELERRRRESELRQHENALSRRAVARRPRPDGDAVRQGQRGAGAAVPGGGAAGARAHRGAVRGHRDQGRPEPAPRRAGAARRGADGARPRTTASG
jgi:multidrug efflux pump subunit AcrA (membrane-fusion protein)